MPSPREWNHMTPTTCVPPSVLALKGPRVPVTAKDKSDAIRVAMTKPWWPRVQKPSRPSPFYTHGRWFFTLHPNTETETET